MRKKQPRTKAVHSYNDLYSKALIALGDPKLVQIAMLADSPTSAEKTAKVQGMKEAIAYSLHALSRIKRDYGNLFWDINEVKNAFNGLTNTVKKSLVEKNHINY